MSIRPVLALLVVIFGLTEAAGAAPAKSGQVVIDFSNLTGAQGTAFTGDKHLGFVVVPHRGNSWLISQDYGDPAPFIYFNSSAEVSINSTVKVMHHGDAFTFASIALYSSITSIPYVFKGTLKGSKVFVQRGTQGNTFGNFAVVDSLYADSPIDKLEVTLTNPIGDNPMGLDNITLKKAAQ